MTTTIFLEANHNNGGEAEETYEVKGTRGTILYGNNDISDFITPQLAPLRSAHFPLMEGVIVELLNTRGLDSGLDLDNDGISERVDVKLEYTVLVFETVAVPAGTFSNVAKVEVRQTDTFFSSAFGISATIKTTLTDWRAPGFGTIKKIEVSQSEGFSDDFAETVTEELVGAVANGQGAGLRIQVTPAVVSTQPTVSKLLEATAFDQSGTPIPGSGFTWNSTDPDCSSCPGWDSNRNGSGNRKGNSLCFWTYKQCRPNHCKRYPSAISRN